LLKRTHIALATAAALLATSISYSHAATYKIDPSHSNIGFKVKHMVVASVRGEFDDFSGTIEYDPDNVANCSVSVTIQASSANTKNKERDENLVGEGFLDATKHATITFTSTSVKKTDDGYVATGDLTIRGVTKSVDLAFEVNGPIVNPWGQTIIGVETQRLKINRHDFGVSWNKSLDNGGLVVGDDISIEITVEAQLAAKD